MGLSSALTQSRGAGSERSVAASLSAGKIAVRLVEFNLHPARYAHQSWYPSVMDTTPLREAISDPRADAFARAEPHLSRWLLREMGLQAELDWEMREPQKRLWLLDAPSLARLARELALAMHREWLLRVIDATRWRALEESLGGQALRFVVEEVPEGAFQYRAPLVNFETQPPAEAAAELTTQGVQTLMALLQPNWRAVRCRAQLYFDRSKDLASVPPFEAQQCERALALICGTLLPRRFPEWAWCF